MNSFWNGFKRGFNRGCDQALIASILMLAVMGIVEVFKF